MQGMRWECGCGQSARQCGESGWKCKKCGESGWGCKESRWKRKNSGRNDIRMAMEMIDSKSEEKSK